MTAAADPIHAVPSADLRTRILEAASGLIAAHGREAATTRAVASAAGVQPPAIYRLFSDKDGLLDAVAEHVMAGYAAEKAGQELDPDPVEDLRRGWDGHIAFCLANPEIFSLMAGLSRPGNPSPATRAGLEVLRARVRRVAEAGRLAVSEERAVALMHGTATGIALRHLGCPPAERDMGLSDTARETVLATITGEAAPGRDGAGLGAAAAHLRASLDDIGALSPGERLLMGELLKRISDGG